jgi:hypothetical protein
MPKVTAEGNRTNFYLPDWLKRRAISKAKAEGRSLSMVVRAFLAAWVAGRLDFPSGHAPRGAGEVKE